jgi:hypothetical protein
VLDWHKSSAQGKDSLEDDEHTSQPRKIRTELKIHEITVFVHANCYQMVDEVAVAAGIRHGTCHRILPDNLNISCVIQHSIP